MPAELPPGQRHTPAHMVIEEFLGIRGGINFIVGSSELDRGRVTLDLDPAAESDALTELRALAEANTGHLNGALKSLKEPLRRADHLVRSLGGPDEAEVKDMPQEFLLEVLEWNEALEEARASDPGSAQREAAFGLKPDLEAQRSERIAAITKLLDPLPDSGSEDLTTARRELNAVRYLDRALGELESLRLADAEDR